LVGGGVEGSMSPCTECHDAGAMDGPGRMQPAAPHGRPPGVMARTGRRSWRGGGRGGDKEGY
jgi:hypothetical protein